MTHSFINAEDAALVSFDCAAMLLHGRVENLWEIPTARFGDEYSNNLCWEKDTVHDQRRSLFFAYLVQDDGVSFAIKSKALQAECAMLLAMMHREQKTPSGSQHKKPLQKKLNERMNPQEIIQRAQKTVAHLQQCVQMAPNPPLAAHVPKTSSKNC